VYSHHLADNDLELLAPDGSRRQGRLKLRFQNDSGPPQGRADSIRTVPFLQHDPDRPEDVMTDSEDHAADEWRYACMSRPYVRTIEKPKPEYPSGYPPYRSGQPGDWLTY
jgi:hypothetical protein